MPSRRGHDLEPFDHVLEAQRGHEGAAPGLQLHQSGRGELHQRFPDRRARNRETRGQALLVEPLPGPKLARHDLVLEDVSQGMLPVSFHSSLPVAS